MKRRILGLLVVFAGCNPAAPPAGSLSRLTEVTTSSRCPSGGVAIAVGVDANANGALDDAEITQTSEVCNGASVAGPAGDAGANGANGTNGTNGTNGVNALVATTRLGAGDANCPAGGARIDTGLDDGAGGGTSGNGVLETGEVRATQYVCNGTEPVYPRPTTLPAGPAGTAVIDVSGGDGDAGMGGLGGDAVLSIDLGTRGGNVKLFKTGVVDAGFAASPAPTFRPGTAPLVVSSDLELVVFGSDAEARDAGVPAYLRVTVGEPPPGEEDPSLRVFPADGGASLAATSLRVEAGKTLGLAAAFYVPFDVHNAGTILGRPSVEVSSSAFYGAPGSSIRATADGAGGFIDLHADGDLINHGTISTRDALPGQQQGSSQVLVNAWYGVLENTGAIDTRPMPVASGPGRPGGNVTLSCPSGRGVRNAGAIDASGGVGTTAGGPAGHVLISSYGRGTLNSGALTSQGGACTATDCSGGDGAFVSLLGYGGDIVNSGRLDASGADGRGVGSGGAGGRVLFFSRGSGTVPVVTPAGSLFVSGTLRATGGRGDVGGQGGRVEAHVVTDGPRGQELVFSGYATLAARGGSSVSGDGASAGTISLINGAQGESAPRQLSGAVVNSTDLIASGGRGVSGGARGLISLLPRGSADAQNAVEFVENHGALLEARSGDSVGACESVPQSNAQVRLAGAHHLLNSGTIDVRGGACLATSGAAAEGGAIELYTNGTLTQAGTLRLSGGAATEQGGSGGSCSARGAFVVNSGAIESHGGDATLAGGSGGRIEVQSWTGLTVNSGTIAARGGTGMPAGQPGFVLVDGNRQL